MNTGNITDSFHEFSVASSPMIEELVFCMRSSQSPFKSALLAKKPGDSLTIEGPFGNFTLPQTSNAVQLIAGGVGITPFKSIISSPHKPDLTLWYFNSSPETAVYINELKSQESAAFQLYLKYGSVTISSLAAVHPDKLTMIAGSTGFVRKVHEILISLGLPDKNILTEDFPGYK